MPAFFAALAPKGWQNLSRKGPVDGLNQHFQPMLAEGSKVRSDPQTEPGAIWKRFRSTSYVEIDVFCLKIIFLVRLTWGMGTHDFRTFFLEKGWPKKPPTRFPILPGKSVGIPFFLVFGPAKTIKRGAWELNKIHTTTTQQGVLKKPDQRTKFLLSLIECLSKGKKSWKCLEVK